MRAFIFLFLVNVFTGCNTRGRSSQKQQVIDTVTLFNPAHVKDETLLEIM